MDKSGVSFVCPFCLFGCGWNAKRQTYDAVQISTERADILQYAHRECVAEDEAEQRSLRDGVVQMRPAPAEYADHGPA